jgi:hypothetical protein
MRQTAAMELTVTIPDDIAARFDAGADLGRLVLEALALAEYRVGRLARGEMQRILGFATRGELDGFLKERGVAESMAADEFEREQLDLDRIGI